MMALVVDGCTVTGGDARSCRRGGGGRRRRYYPSSSVDCTGDGLGNSMGHGLYILLIVLVVLTRAIEPLLMILWHNGR